MSGIWVYGKITAVDDVFTPFSNYADVTLEGEMPLDQHDSSLLANNGAIDEFELGAWSDTTGWPAVACFHEQRLVFARTSHCHAKAIQ